MNLNHNSNYCDCCDLNQETYIYEQNSFAPLALIDKESHINYYHNDHIGTPRELTNEQGKIVWEAQYKTWGNVAKEVYNQEESKIVQSFRFQGQYYDQETGLHYNRFCYYDADIGRFVSQDPIGLFGGTNLYQYAPNPVGWVDPLGLSADCPSKNEVSRKGAFREAKRDANIPTSQQPIKQANGKQYREVGMESKGNIIRYENGSKKGQQIMTREYDFINTKGEKITIQDHSAGHKFGESNGLGDEMSHFNVRPTGESRGKVNGTKPHYNFKSRD